MKSIISVLLLMSSAAYSQGVFNNEVNAALQKVIKDFPNQFNNIKGSAVPGNRQAVVFKSEVDVPGSINCTIIQSATQKRTSSWKCIMLESRNFNDAKTRFRELYDQIKNTIVKIDGERPFILNGKFESPSEDKHTTTILFELLAATGDMQKLKVDLTLTHAGNDWRITLSVYEQDYSALTIR